MTAGQPWAKYLEGAYRRTLEEKGELLEFVAEIAKAVDLHDDATTFTQVLENVRGLRAAYASMCERLHEAVQRHRLGLGGEHVDELVISALDEHGLRWEWLDKVGMRRGGEGLAEDGCLLRIDLNWSSQRQRKAPPHLHHVTDYIDAARGGITLHPTLPHDA